MSLTTRRDQPDEFRRQAHAHGPAEHQYSRVETGTHETPGTWARVVGEILFRWQVAERMGWDVSQVEAAQKDHALLACRTRDGVHVFPAFQFRDHQGGELVSGFADVMRVFQGTDVDHWAIASWFVTPLRLLENRSPIEVLTTGAGLDDVLGVARDQARAWDQ